MTVVSIVFTFLALVCAVIYFLTRRKFNYWKDKNVPHVEPTALLGNYGSYILQREHMGGVAQRLCKRFPEESAIGAYYGTEPALLVQDPALIKLILTKDFNYFSSREIMEHADREVMGRGIFFTYGSRWKIIRQNVAPFFTSAKMKNMFYLVRKCAYQLENLLDDEMEASNVQEITSITSRYTMDSIGSCGFGIEINTMGKDVNNPYRVVGPSIFGNSIGRGFRKVARSIWPGLFYGLGCTSYPPEIAKFFAQLLTGVFEQRGYKPTSRNDFIDMMLSLKQSNYITDDSVVKKAKNDRGMEVKVDDEFLVAQSMTMFAAGFETSSSTMSFTLYELAKNPEAQARVLKEIDDLLLRHDGRLEYNCVSELPYLEACVHEAMRLYPVLGVLTREVVKNYTLPSGVELDKGVHIHIPVYHLHHHPEYFPDPEQFRPERFLGNQEAIKPYTYLPFGEGPRICIGIRFGKMQVLAGLVTVLKKYRVELAPDMPREVRLEARTPTLQPQGGLRLKLLPRQHWQLRVYKRFEEESSTQAKVC